MITLNYQRLRKYRDAFFTGAYNLKTLTFWYLMIVTAKHKQEERMKRELCKGGAIWILDPSVPLLSVALAPMRHQICVRRHFSWYQWHLSTDKLLFYPRISWRKENKILMGHMAPMELLFVALKQNHCRFLFGCLKASWLHNQQLCLLPFLEWPL